MVLVTPGVAAAEGPGYGGKADRLILKKKAKDPAKPKESGAELAVFGVGFRAGSQVTLRVGSGADATVHADETGALRVQLNGQTPAGTTIVATGQTPSGSAWTLLGSVPADEPSGGRRDFTSWIVAALGVLALAGGFVPRLRRARQGSKR